MKTYGKDNDDLGDIQNSPNVVYQKYLIRIDKAISTILKAHPWNKEDLQQEAALFFFNFCRKFDPNHKGNNMNFADAFFFNLYRHLIGYIQKQHIKNNKHTKHEDIDQYEFIQDTDMNKELLEEELINIINLFTDKQRTILIDIINGIKQKETGEKLSIGQSRISHMRKAICELSQDPNHPAYLLKKYLQQKED